MTPAARLAAAIEILDLVIASAREGGAAADTLVQRYFATRRYAGGGDRRAVRALVFEAIRSLGELPVSGRAALIAHLRHADPAALALFGSGGHAPAALVQGEPEAVPGLVPGWLMDRLAARFGPEAEALAAALLQRAPLDLRVNRLKAGRDDVLGQLDGAEALAAHPDALRLPAGTAIEALPAFVEGLIEVQDLGSQLAAAALEAAPGETILDLCAGAGGKTLALAAAMANDGRLIASDTDRARLGQMPPRLLRAGVSIVETRLLDGGREAEALADLAGGCDRVMVDAPCSGSGTWRRNPEARWRLTPARLDRLAEAQARLLDLAAAMVRPGGRLTYVVCSVLPEEGADQAAALVARNPAFEQAGPELLLTPQRHGCDGFSITSLRRIG
jgi:16S rRNA (cytosine967-C5)-methyltransferase